VPSIAVVGTGYVGLTVGACLAEYGNVVTCVDSDAERIESLLQGSLPFYEPGLPELVGRNQAVGRLSFTTDLDDAVKRSLLIYITVGTPDAGDGSADLQQVETAAAAIGKAMNGYRIIVMKSTVPVGTSELVRDVISRTTDEDFDVVSNPEFLKEGNAIADFTRPDRIVIGTSNRESAAVLQELYAPFVRTTGNPILVMDSASAEMVKYAANAMLATRISVMNEFANLSERVGADIESVRQGIGHDHRIGNHFIFAGVGFGGSCFPKDLKALIQLGRRHGCKMEIASAVERVNEEQKQVLAEKVIERFGSSLTGRRIAVWGLSFKPKTDDIRNAPSLAVVERLLGDGASVAVYDPAAMNRAKEILGDRVTYSETHYDALEDADALLVVTEWAEFRNADFKRIRRLMRTPVLFDGRNIYDPQMTRDEGFEYHGIGRRTN